MARAVVAEFLRSDVTLIGAALAGLALTAIAILRDLGAVRWHQQRTVTVEAKVGPAG